MMTSLWNYNLWLVGMEMVFHMYIDNRQTMTIDLRLMFVVK